MASKYNDCDCFDSKQSTKWSVAFSNARQSKFVTEGEQRLSYHPPVGMARRTTLSSVGDVVFIEESGTNPSTDMNDEIKEVSVEAAMASEHPDSSYNQRKSFQSHSSRRTSSVFSPKDARTMHRTLSAKESIRRSAHITPETRRKSISPISPGINRGMSTVHAKSQPFSRRRNSSLVTMKQPDTPVPVPRDTASPLSQVKEDAI